ncbi:MAG: efflux RND transporter periplasmic adaptor subunit [Alphaproteobacteria bacterium]|nr:efflux RND transporter periplasmic adaptor subunit [Alphaproteobacteria bacterium]
MLMTKPHKTVVLRRLAFIILCVSLGWFLKAKTTPRAGMMGMMGQTPYVLVERVQMQDTLKAQNHIAHVEAINSVSLQPRVSGMIDAVLFEEGSFVKEGDILFEIESDTFKATLDLRAAELERAKAALTEAERNYERQKKLSGQNISSKASFDAAESAFLQAKAGVAEAKASWNLANISYEDTFSRAPISGYIGKALVTKGNRVVASQQVLAKIVQLNPVRVAFNLTDKEFLAFKSKAKGEKNPHIKARITLPDGTLVVKDFISGFVDNEVSKNTATVSIYGDFENDDEKLVPGSYVQIALILEPKMRIVVPQAALMQDENGFYVFVVNEHSVAEERRLVLGEVSDDKQVVEEGLNEGEMVVVKGVQKLSNGIKVQPSLVGSAR